MRHPATHMRTTRRIAGSKTDYHKMKGTVGKGEKVNNKKVESNKSHGHKSDQSSLRLDRGRDSG